MKILLSILSFAFIISCTSPTVNSEERKQITEIVQSPETVLVDVRIPSQFSEKTADKAVNIPLAEIENNLDFFRKQKNIVLFCNSGNQSNQALEILKKNGITNVYNAKTLENVEALQKEKK